MQLSPKDGMFSTSAQERMPGELQQAVMVLSTNSCTIKCAVAHSVLANRHISDACTPCRNLRLQHHRGGTAQVM